MTTAFISYSWDSDAHKTWVRDFAARLRGAGIETVLDQWHLVPGDQMPKFMETAVRESDYVLVICTPRYKDRSDNRVGGVGYEGDIMTSEVLTSQNQRKFIPILRSGTWEQAAASWVTGKWHINLGGDPYSESQFDDLLTTLHGIRPQAPPVGAPPTGVRPVRTAAPASAPGPAGKDFEPLRITGVVVDEISTPRNDGSRGSALYIVPFRLSRQPPPNWALMFVAAWNSPPQFSGMHRPGIASVRGQRIILSGTTVEEVEKYHRETLILCVNEANKQYIEMEEAGRRAQEAERLRREEHERKVRDAAARIKFDD